MAGAPAGLKDWHGRARALLETYWLILAFAVMALQAALVLTHDPWLDEWQAIQITVQSPDLRIFLRNLSYEGHPPLWYLALWIGAKIAGPYGALGIAALVCSLISQYLVLFRSPFSRAVRLGIALSAIILFEFNTISRSYTLGVTLLFWLMTTWDHRRLPWIPIILLPSLEFFFGVFTLIFIAKRWAEGRIWWPGLGLWVLVSILSAITIIPAADNVPQFQQAGANALSNFFRYPFHLSAAVLPIGFSDGRLLWNTLPPFYTYMILWSAFVAMCIDETRRFALDRMALMGFMAMQWGFYVLLSPLAIRHALLPALLLILLVWRKSASGRGPTTAFRVWLAINVFCGVCVAAINLTQPFDKAEETAEFIRAEGLGRAHWAVFPRFAGQGLSALTGMKFERAGHECLQDAIRWNARDVVRGSAGHDAWLAEVAPRRGRFYFLSNYQQAETDTVRLIRHVPAGYDNWQFNLYVVNPDKPLWQPDMPSCTPDLRPFTDKPAIPLD